MSLTSELTTAIAGRRSVVLAFSWAAFLAALFVFAFDQQAIGAVNGWWWDELFSLWASDPAQPFTDALSRRILPDSNPPLYYTVLYWTRQFIGDARSAAIFIDLVVLAGAILSVLAFSKKAGALPLGLIASAAFLLSGPVLRYAAETRSYFCAIALTFVVSWLSASAVFIPRRPPAWVSFAVISALSPTIHVYSALMCCCLATGLVLAVWLHRRSDLWRPSLALGIPAGAITFAWLSFARAAGSIGNLEWIQFSLDKVLHAAGEVLLLAYPVGLDIAALDFSLHTAHAPLREVAIAAFPTMVAPAVISLSLLFGFSNERLRVASTVFGTCFLLFFLVPVVISFHTPIITGRYWMIGTPATTVVLLFFIGEWIDEARKKQRCWQFSLGTAAVATLFVGWTTLQGFGAARAFVVAKPYWDGGALVSSLGRNCGPRSIHVLIHFPKSLGPSSYSYAFVSNMPQDAFVPVFTDGVTSGRADASCPVLGWAEHAVHLDVQSATDQELLDLLKLDGRPCDVRILRHRKGYLVLRLPASKC
jgi:hypothetical protein